MRFVDGRLLASYGPRDTLAAILGPRRSSVPAGKSNNTNDGARAWWAETVLPALTDAPAIDLAKPGTVREIIERYRREILPTLPETTAAEDRRYCTRLEKAFGDRPYAVSEADTAKGVFVRTMDISAISDRRKTKSGL